MKNAYTTTIYQVLVNSYLTQIVLIPKKRHIWKSKAVN